MSTLGTDATPTLQGRTLILKCPKCKQANLGQRDLEPNLVSNPCDACTGQWVTAKAYWAWIEGRGKPASATAGLGPESDTPTLPVSESESPKFCPECGRFLRRYKVGHGFEFCIERCGTCGGFWLDGNEWELLRSRNAHDRLHFVAGDAWQADVTRAQRERGHEQIVRAKIGDDDLVKIKEIKAWLDGHPRRTELYAFLLDHAER